MCGCNSFVKFGVKNQHEHSVKEIVGDFNGMHIINVKTEYIVIWREEMRYKKVMQTFFSYYILSNAFSKNKWLLVMKTHPKLYNFVPKIPKKNVEIGFFFFG